MSEFRSVKLSDLRESKTNPRKHFDNAALHELAESIRQKGVLQPILARPVNGHLELVAGARRFRAAEMAGLKEIPAVVRELTDEQAIEAQIIENLQREDVTAMEEAEGFQAWLDRGHKPDELAKKIGKSIRHVYARLELRKLSPKVQAAISRGEISATHGGVLARLSDHKQQDEELAGCAIEDWSHRDASDGERIGSIGDKAAGGAIKALISVRDLEARVMARKIGEDLIAKQKEVIAELAKDETIHDPAKLVHLITDAEYVQTAAVLNSRKWKSREKKPCGSKALGIFVDPSKRGQVIKICCGAANCGTHFKLNPVSSASPGIDAKQRAAMAREEAKRKRSREIEKLVTAKLLKLVCANVPGKLGAPELRAIAERLDNPSDEVCKLLGLKTCALAKLDAEGLARYAIGAILTDDVEYSSGSGALSDLAAAYKIDRKAVEKQATEEADRLIRWTDAKGGGSRGAASGTGHVYEIKKSSKSHKYGDFEWTRTKGAYAAASPFKTLDQAKASAEATEANDAGHSPHRHPVNAKKAKGAK